MSVLKTRKIPGYEVDPETKECVAVPFKYDDHYYAFFGEDNPGTKTKNKSHYKANTTSRKAAMQMPSSYKKNSSVKPPAVDRGSSDINKKCKSKIGPRKELFTVPMASNKISKESQLPKPANSRVHSNSVETQPLKIPSSSATFASMKSICESQVPVPQNIQYIPTPSKSTSRSPAKQLVRFPMTPSRSNARRGSLNEFLTLEQQCLSVKKPSLNTGSQMSAICKLFENNTLRNATEESASATNILNEIRRLIKMEQSRLDANLQKFIEENRTSNQNLEHLNILVNKLEQQIGDQNEENKENTACNSILTPTVYVKDVQHSDPRKYTLTKNLFAACQNDQVLGTRAKNAEDLYTSTKNSCSILLTPKAAERPLQAALTNSTNSAVRFLSIRIQEQCMMLQDTPASK